VAVCILIPAYDAERSIGPVVRECAALGYPVVVVDDGSRDATAAVVAAQQLGGVTLLTHGRNRGKGGALRTGFRWALDNGFDAVVTVDADGQHDVSATPRLIAAARSGEFGILIASRHSQFRQMAGLRKIWNRIGVWCMRKRTGFEITDSQSGFRYYSRRLLENVQLKSQEYSMEMEVLIKAWKGGFTIGSIPVAARVVDGRSTSHYRPVSDTFSICMTFLRYM
jgi:glycosyltransferase involved in cell wall biosynthesis